MKFSRVDTPLPGEQTVRVIPDPEPQVSEGLIRPRYVTGRSVSDRALESEQEYRIIGANLLGRALEPGLVEGLEVTRASASEPARLDIAPGLGLCGNGEDVILGRAVQVQADALPVRGVHLLFDREPVDLEREEPADGTDLGSVIDVLRGPPPPEPVLADPVSVSSFLAKVLDDTSTVEDHAAVLLTFAKDTGLSPGDDEVFEATIEEITTFTRLSKEPGEEKLVDQATDLIDDLPWLAPAAKAHGEFTDRLATDGVIDSADAENRALVRLIQDFMVMPDGSIASTLPKTPSELPDTTDEYDRLKTQYSKLSMSVSEDQLKSEALARVLVAQARDDMLTRMEEKQVALIKSKARDWSDHAKDIAELAGYYDDLDEDVAMVMAAREILILGNLELLETKSFFEDVYVTPPDETARPTIPYAAMVLVAVPYFIDDLGAAGGPTDPCERDPDAEPFYDWRYLDTSGLAWVPIEVWLDEVLTESGAIPDFWSGPVDEGSRNVDALRNELAWSLFDLERVTPTLPTWSRDSVPLALAVFDMDGELLYLDPPAVVRHSGPPSPAPLVSGGGSPALWRAQVDQLAEHLATEAFPTDVVLGDRLRRLPPVGILPRPWFDLYGRTTTALTAGVGVNAAPIPIDQLDAVFAAAAPLAAFPTRTDKEELRVLLPVPEDQWDPDLLQIEAVDEAFQRTLNAARARVQRAVRARTEIRAKIDALLAAVGGPDLLPVRTPDDGEEGDAQAIWDGRFWRNDTAVSALTADDVASPTALLDLVATAWTDLDPDAVLVDAYTAVLDGDHVGPVAVVADDAESVSLRASSGFSLGARWTHASMAENAPLPEVRINPSVTLISGELDAPAIDRAVTRAGASPMLIIAASITPSAREDIIFRQHRGLAVPLVADLRLDPATNADLVEDVRLRLGATAVSGHPEEYAAHAAADASEGLVVTLDDTRLVVTNASTAGAIPSRVSALRTEIDGLPVDSVERLGLERRLTVLTGSSAVIFGPRTPLEAGGRHVDHLLAMQQIADALVRLPTEADRAARQQAVSLEPAVGTEPTSEGLGVTLATRLLERLAALKAPGSERSVISEAQLNLIAGDEETPAVGLSGLAAVLSETANRADDAVDFAFVQLQAATFRLREAMTGRDQATRMATSPILAQVADVVRPDLAPTRISAFFTALKSSPIEPIMPDDGGDGGGGGGGGGDPTLTLDESFIREDRLHDIIGGLDPSDPRLGFESLEADTVGDPVYESGTSTLSGDDSYASLYLKDTETSVLRDSGEIFTRESLSETSVLKTRTLASSLDAGTPQASTAWQLDSSVQAKIDAATFVTPTATLSTSFTVERMLESVELVEALRPVDYTVRDTGIATRIEDPIAVEVSTEASRLRATITQTLVSLSLNLSDLRVPMLLRVDASSFRIFRNYSLFYVLGTDTEDAKIFDAAILTGAALHEQIVSGVHDPQKPGSVDPATLFDDATRTLDATAAMLRAVEVQIRLVRQAVRLIQHTTSLIKELVTTAQQREAAIVEQLAEARHDLLTTTALIAEEQERVDVINARRERVLEEAVPFVVFHRIREVEARDAAPVHDVVPALSASPVVEALRHPAPPVPADLSEAVELWRDAPARWLVELDAVLDRIDRLAALRRVLEATRRRADLESQLTLTAPDRLTGLRGLQAVRALARTRKVSLAARRTQALQVRVEAVSRLTWRQALVLTRRVVTVGDLADSTSAPASVSRKAADQLDQIQIVTANLYRELSLVEPRLRARWVLRISEFDRPLDLSDLTVLPGWHEVGEGATSRPDPFRKRELQALVDWLFSRVDPAETEALALMNDLVRIAILTASHAPVGRILAGRVKDATPIQRGSHFPITIDPDQVRIGMTAVVMAGGVVRARAVVEDLASGHATARVVSEVAAGVVLQPTDTVRFVESDGITLADGDAIPYAELGLTALARTGR